MFKLFVVLGSILACCYAVDSSKGEVWPKPQQQLTSEDYLVIQSHTFKFKGPADIGCPDFLNAAFTRYWTIIATSSSLAQRGQVSKAGRQPQKKFREVAVNPVGDLDSLNVALIGECANEAVLPDLGDDESYTLTISREGWSTLSASTIWGVLRGLETFSQLIHLEGESLVVKATTISDFPRFSHRGVLLDTGRHFQPVYIILQILDAMAYNKFNVLHWHLTDQLSFPYVSRTYPELSEQGAYHPVTKVYEQTDVSKIIEYARVRGIRVIPEFPIPSYSRSWGYSHPELLTPCYTDGQPNGELGAIDPTKNSTYTFLANLYKEVVDVFPDAYINMGGDNVDFTCWENNPDVQAWMSDNNMSMREELDGYFFLNIASILESLNAKYITVEQTYFNALTLPNSTIVQVWWEVGLQSLARLTEAGKFGLYSTKWFLDDLSSGGDWEKFYNCEPLNFDGTDEQKKRVLGGEALMFSDVVNEYNIMPRLWPRASAIAEKLWSAQDVDIGAARSRLEEHVCRMNRRGIAAQPPNGAGVCL